MKKYLVCCNYLKGERAINWLIRPWRMIYYLYKDFDEIVQRGLYGFAYSDCWNLDHYVARVQIGALAELQKGRDKIGFENDPGLEEMIKGFQALLDLDYGMPGPAPDITFKPSGHFIDGEETFEAVWGEGYEEWSRTNRQYNEEQAAIFKKGFELWAKEFRGLWW